MPYAYTHITLDNVKSLYFSEFLYTIVKKVNDMDCFQIKFGKTNTYIHIFFIFWYFS